MADQVSIDKLNAPENRAKVEQSISLIQRGKAGIAGQDPQLRPFVNSLVRLGIRDITQLPKSRLKQNLDKASEQGIFQSTGKPVDIKSSTTQFKTKSTPEVLQQKKITNVKEFIRSGGTRKAGQEPQPIPQSRAPPTQGPRRPTKLKGTPKNVPEQLQPFTGKRVDNVNTFIKKQPSKLSTIESILGPTKERVVFERTREIESEKQESALKQLKIEIQEFPEFAIKRGVPGRSTEKGFEFDLSIPNIQNIRTESILQAEKEFEQKDPYEKVIRRGSSAAVGGLSLVGGGIKFIGGLGATMGKTGFKSETINGERVVVKNKGFQEIKIPKLFQSAISSPRKEFTVSPLESPLKFLHEVGQSPIIGTQVALTLPFIPQAVKGAGKFIVSPSKTKEVITFAKSFSPIRTTNNIFTSTLASNEEISAVVQKVGKGKDTVRLIKGEGVNKQFTIEAVQQSTKVKGVQGSLTNIRISQPAISIKEGVVKNAIQVSNFESIGLGKGSLGDVLGGTKKTLPIKEVLSNIQGAGVTSLTRPTSRAIFSEGRKSIVGNFELINTNKFAVTRAAGISTSSSLEGVSFFTGGRRESVLKTKEVFEGGRIFRPSGKVRFKPTISGFEFNSKSLDAIDKEVVKDVLSGSGGVLKSKKKTPLSQTFSLQQQELTSGIEGSLKQVKPFKVSTSSKKIIPVKSSGGKSPSTISTKELQAETTHIPLLKNKIPSRVKTVTAVKPRASQKQFRLSRLKHEQKRVTVNIQKPLAVPKVKTSISQRPKSRIKTRQKTQSKQIQKVITERVKTPVITPVISTKIPHQPTKLKIPFGFGSKKKSKVRIKRGRFGVSVKRFGKFKNVGFGSTKAEAINIGKSVVGKTLGATFRVEGLTKSPSKIKGFKKKKTKKGVVFIEQPKFRLSTGTELKEIQSFKNLQGGIRI